MSETKKTLKKVNYFRNFILQQYISNILFVGLPSLFHCGLGSCFVWLLSLGDSLYEDKTPFINQNNTKECATDQAGC